MGGLLGGGGKGYVAPSQIIVGGGDCPPPCLPSLPMPMQGQSFTRKDNHSPSRLVDELAVAVILAKHFNKS